MGDDVAIGDHTNVYNLGFIRIGDRTTISQGAHLCGGSHDLNMSAFPLVRAEINVGSDCWICADAFVGPFVTIGDQSVVGARAVAVKNVPSGIIVAGNPAKKVKDRPTVSS